ncbi:MAG: tetratricopeptide repeat protein, partial [Methanothrix sp.]|nr:tetratricopeptide repeat protein [Methanothrix sp.]
EAVRYGMKRDKSENVTEKQNYNLKALKLYIELSSDDPRHGEVWYNLANAYYLENDIPKAVDAYNESLQGNRLPDDKLKSMANFNRGNSYFMLGKANYDDAAKSFYEAIWLNENYLDAYNNLALVQIEQEKYSEANNISDIVLGLIKNEKSKDHDIQAIRAWNNKGLALNRLKRYDEALLALQNSNEIRKNPYSYLYMGLIAAELNQQLEESLRLLREALLVGGESLSDRDRFLVKNSMGNVYLKFQDYSNATSAFRDALDITYKRGPSWNNASAWIGNATALMHLKNRNLDALASFNQALKQDPTNAEAYNGKGDVLYQLGCYEDAIRAYQNGLNHEEGYDRADIQLYLSIIILIIAGIAIIAALIMKGKIKLIASDPAVKPSTIDGGQFYKIIFPSALIIQLISFLFVIYMHFPQKVVFKYLCLSIVILAFAAFLWVLNLKNEKDIWLTLEKDLNGKMTWFWILALISLFILGAAPIIIRTYEEYGNNPYDMAYELIFIILSGFFVSFIASNRTLTSYKTSNMLRKAAMIFSFCWLGLNSLYLSQLLWCWQLAKLNTPLDIGLVTIPSGTPIMVALTILIFVVFFLIPYIIGWRTSRQKQKKLLTQRVNDFKTITTILQLDTIEPDTKHTEISSLKEIMRLGSKPVENSFLENQVLAQLTNLKEKNPSEQVSKDYEFINIISKKIIEDTQKELEILNADKPQIWIAAVSLLSPLIIQILSSWAIQAGLSSKPESLFSGLTQILTGI